MPDRPSRALWAARLLEAEGRTERAGVVAPRGGVQRGYSRVGWLRARSALIVETCGIVLAAVVVLGVFAIQARALLTYPYFIPGMNLEEASYTHIVVRNFLEYGFWNSGFLQDVAASHRPEDHPFLYNHMPPGHEIMLALISRLFDQNYVAVHLVQFSFVPVGFVFYILFLRRLLGQINVVGAGFVVVFMSLWQLLTNSSHPHNSPFLLLLCAPLLAAARFHETERKRYAAIALGLLLAASWTLDYVLLSSIVTSWVALWLTRLWPLRARLVGMAGAAVAAGILLHLVQNALVLGGELFIRELTYVLGNRLFGVPSSEALVGFYQDAAILHHGSRPLSAAAVVRVIAENMDYIGGERIALGLLLGLVACLAVRRGRSFTGVRMSHEALRVARFLGRLALWVVAALITPIVLFPALAQDMNLHGLVHSYFLAIPFLAATLWVGSLTWRSLVPLTGLLTVLSGRTARVWPRPIPHHRLIFNFTVLMAAALVVALGVAAVLRHHRHERREIASLYLGKEQAASLRYLEHIPSFADGVFMTNVNTPLVGFLTRQPGFGVCGLDSVDDSGDVQLGRCRVAMMREYKRYLDQRPRYFFFFTVHFPGFSTCRPHTHIVDPGSGLTGAECHAQQRERLDRLFPVVFEAEDVRIYDLAASVATQRPASALR